MPEPHWVYADFNGWLASNLLCIAHADRVKNRAGDELALAPGMRLTAYDDDADEQNRPDAIFASGIVEPSPPVARCRGSRWALRIDAHGIRHESDVRGSPGDT